MSQQGWQHEEKDMSPDGIRKRPVSLLVAFMLLSVYGWTAMKMLNRSRSTNRFDQIPEMSDLIVVVPLLVMIPLLFVSTILQPNVSRVASYAAVLGVGLYVGFTLIWMEAWGG